MARIIKKGRDLERDYQTCQKRVNGRNVVALICFVAAVLSALFMMKMNLYKGMVIPFALGAAAVVSLLSAAPYVQEMNILSAGIAGENEASRCLSMLPDSYTVFRNLTVSYQGKSSEIDTVVVGPAGIFVVEIKNLNGTIFGRVEDQQWRQEKVGRGGTLYGKDFYSPVKQVGTHVFRLAKYLQERGLRNYVNACVYFSNPLATVYVTGTDGKTAVFSAAAGGAHALLMHLSQPQAQMIAPADCQRIVQILEQA